MPDLISELLQGVSHHRAGRPDLAEGIYRDVLRRDPGQPNALYLYGLLKLQDGRAAAAAELLEAATRHRTDPDAHLHLARARLAAGDPGGALLAVDAALPLGAARSQALYLRGTALNALGRPGEAIGVLGEAAQIDPTHAATQLNLGNAYADLDRTAEAERHLRNAIVLDPGLVEAHASLGHFLGTQGRLAEAEAACRAALALDPMSAEAHWNLATILLLAGDYDRGFAEYEWHRKHPLFSAYWRDLPGPAWTGGPLAGKTLLVHAGQGLGDTIQLVRFAPALAARGARVILACAAPLIPLLDARSGLAAVVSRSEPLPHYDLWVDQMSLPRLLAAQPDETLYKGPYIFADPTRAERWAARLTGESVGFAWAGNHLHLNDRHRSLPLAAAGRIACPGMLSLQVGPRAAEASALGLPDHSATLTDFAETAALMANLVLVITVDTSVAHLAGALGVPTWLLLPAAPDWRWIQGRTDTPWYPSVRLFRQTIAGDWDGPIDAINAELPLRQPSPLHARCG